MVDRVASTWNPFMEPDFRRPRVVATGSAAGTVQDPPVARLAGLAWVCDWEGLADVLGALTADERSAVLRMAEDLAEAAERAMQGDR